MTTEPRRDGTLDLGTLHLGTQGERAVDEILTVLELARGFSLAFVTSPYPAALGEARRRMGGHVDTCAVIAPDGDVDAVVADASRGERQLVWVEGNEPPGSAWRTLLASLNTRREELRAHGHLFLVLAGTPALVELARTAAPDLFSIASITRDLPEPPVRRVAGATVRWLHLSDLHFEATQRWDRRIILKALLRDVVEPLAGKALTPHAVVITGDIAQSGQPAEYEQAENFFARVSQATSLDPRDAFFLVPGNHDVDWRRIGPADDAIIGGISHEERLDAIFEHAPTMDLLGARLEAFYAFTGRLLGAARAWRPDRPWRVDVREIEGIPVAFLQLNSAWSTSQRGPILIGRAQLRSAMEEAAGTLVKIALSHHPLDDLLEWDRAHLRDIYESPDGPELWLHGHLHDARARGVATPTAGRVTLAAGASYVHERWPKSVQLIELDLARGEARVHLYAFSDRDGGFWAPDASAYRDAKDGIVTLPLPPELHLGTAPDAAGIANMAAPSAPVGDESLIARYRHAASAVFGAIRFIGLPDHAPRPNVRIHELFVPLRLRGGSRPDELTKLSSVVASLTAAGDEPRRVIVLGDPGSGKNTLCQHLTVHFCEETPLLPLYLRIRDYAQRIADEGDLGIVDFLSEHATRHLQTRMPTDVIERALESGGAVLVVDGLDEVVDRAERAKVAERIEALARSHPRAPVLATSRIAGYGEAPLSEAEWTLYRLEPFDDEELRAFVTRWYTIQEPRDAAARARGIAELTAALEAEASAKELARTPLLATLIALVHRHEARLPGQRGRLYDLCVRTLLQTWPAAGRRRFTEIDEPLQRAYLERLAFELIDARDGRAVVVTREDLLLTLTRIATERHPDEEGAAARVARWIDHLERDTGLLVEQQPGTFAFVHLSLMEYLAACGLERQAPSGLAEAIVERITQPGWHEPCLLAVANHAEDGLFLDELFTRLVEREDGLGTWIFLLHCMREEADFRAEQREAILDGVLRHVGTTWDRRSFAFFRWPTRFSRRHGEAVAAWLEAELAQTSGDRLLRVVSVVDEGRAAEILSARADARSVAGELLFFYPWDQAPGVAAWAARTASATGALAWADKHAGVAMLAGVQALQQPMMSTVCAGLAMGVTLSAGLPREARMPGRALAVEPGGTVVVPLRWPARRAPASWSLERLEVTVRLGKGRLNLSGYSSDVRYVHQDIAFLLQGHTQFVPFDEDLQAVFHSVTTEAPDWPVPTVGTPPVWGDHLAVLAAMKAEIDAANPPDKQSEAVRRVRARFILMAWEALGLDEALGDNPPPERLALYLALGWGQCHTTGRWPATARWSACFDAPPAHWLARAHWHICWLVHDPTDAEHQRGLRDAIDEGASDDALPDYAATLEKLLCEAREAPSST